MPFVKKIISGLRVTFEDQQQTQFFTATLRLITISCDRCGHNIVRVNFVEAVRHQDKSDPVNEPIILRFVRVISPAINEHASCCPRPGKVLIDSLGMRPTSTQVARTIESAVNLQRASLATAYAAYFPFSWLVKKLSYLRGYAGRK